MKTLKNRRLLAVNGGSSSIKFAMFSLAVTASPATKIFRGSIERIGLPGATFQVNGQKQTDNFSKPVTAPDYATAVKILLDWLEIRVADDSLSGIGHRVVHGGALYSAPARITTKLIEDLGQISYFDPEHLPGELQIIAAFRQAFSDIPQVACFDTAFHHDLPRVAKLLPIPRRYEALGVRRYGFHGLSYAYLMKELPKSVGPLAARGRVILAHLGNGASLAAVQDSKSLDTSMSLTPAAGIPMGTRSGDIDPGLAWYLAQTEGRDAKSFNEMVNFQSGLLGLSETSSDMRDLLECETHDIRAAEAISFFCYQVKKWIGAFAAALGGLDILVFSGGIGEHAPEIRVRICEGLSFLGIELDSKRNAANDDLISTESARVLVRVMGTDEESMIATTVCHVLGFANSDN